MPAHDDSPINVAWGESETLALLKDLMAKAERGELTCVALRVFKKDGTWEDFVIGGDSEEERAQALKELQESYKRTS
jgi:hypothetical protein